MLGQHCFSEICHLIFDFFNSFTFVVHFMLDLDPELEPECITVPVLLRQKVAAPSVPFQFRNTEKKTDKR
jgi:hypothetical protein